MAALIIPAAACIAMPDLLNMFGYEFTLYDWYVTCIAGCVLTIRLLYLVETTALTKKLAIIQACIAITLGLDWATGGAINSVAVGFFWLAAEVLAFVSFLDGAGPRVFANSLFGHDGGDRCL